MKTHLLAISLLLCASYLAGQAVTLWDGTADYRSGGNEAISGTTFADTPNVGDTTETLALNPSTPLFSEGPAVFGGFHTVAVAGVEGFSGALAAIHRGGDNPEVIRFQNTVDTSTSRYMGGLVFGRDAALPSDLQDGAFLRATVSASNPIGGFRFVIEDSGNYFVSQAFFPSAIPTADFVLTITGADDGNWMQHDFSSSFDVDEILSFTPINFTNITGVGVYYEAATTETGTMGNLQGNISRIQVFVPEPSAVALLLGGLALGFVVIRRRF